MIQKQCYLSTRENGVHLLTGKFQTVLAHCSGMELIGLVDPHTLKHLHISAGDTNEYVCDIPEIEKRLNSFYY